MLRSEESAVLSNCPFELSFRTVLSELYFLNGPK